MSKEYTGFASEWLKPILKLEADEAKKAVKSETAEDDQATPPRCSETIDMFDQGGS